MNEKPNIFKDKNSQVSCHWLISKRGKLYKIVDEKNVAWHAGISYWKGDSMLNNKSIGIELDNIGHGRNYKTFSNIQMSALEELLKLLINKETMRKLLFILLFLNIITPAGITFTLSDFFIQFPLPIRIWKLIIFKN